MKSSEFKCVKIAKNIAVNKFNYYNKMMEPTINQYIVAYVNMHINELHQVLVEDYSEVGACIKYLSKYEDVYFAEGDIDTHITLEDFKERMVDMDTCISVYKLE